MWWNIDLNIFAFTFHSRGLCSPCQHIATHMLKRGKVSITQCSHHLDISACQDTLGSPMVPLIEFTQQAHTSHLVEQVLWPLSNGTQPWAIVTPRALESSLEKQTWRQYPAGFSNPLWHNAREDGNHAVLKHTTGKLRKQPKLGICISGWQMFSSNLLWKQGVNPYYTRNNLVLCPDR